MKHTTPEEEKEQLSLYELLSEGLLQIEERHDQIINGLRGVLKSEQLESIVSLLHYTRLQARGLRDKTKAHFVEYAHLYND